MLALTGSAHADGMEPPGPPASAATDIVRKSSPGQAASDGAESAADAIIEPEHTVTATISNRDVNRIHCPVAVADVFFSKEKPVDVTPAGDDVYVKVKKKLLGTVETPVTMPIDLHVVCGDEVYTMILQPRNVDAVTLRLGNPLKTRALSIAREWGALPIEDKVQRLTRMVYRDELPTTFVRTRLKDDRRFTRFWKNLAVRGVQRVTAPGLGLAAIEYEVVPLTPITLDERDFLSTEISSDIVAITVDPLTYADTTTHGRLIVIERSIGDGR